MENLEDLKKRVQKNTEDLHNLENEFAELQNTLNKIDEALSPYKGKSEGNCLNCSFYDFDGRCGFWDFEFPSICKCGFWREKK